MTLIQSLMGFVACKPEKKINTFPNLFFLYPFLKNLFKKKKKTLKNKFWIVHKSTSHIILPNIK